MSPEYRKIKAEILATVESIRAAMPEAAEYLEQHVLSWGTHAHVLGPQELRDRVAKVAADLVKRYGGHEA